jgi:hypothetical protein
MPDADVYPGRKRRKLPGCAVGVGQLDELGEAILLSFVIVRSPIAWGIFHFETRANEIIENLGSGYRNGVLSFCNRSSVFQKICDRFRIT